MYYVAFCISLLNFVAHLLHYLSDLKTRQVSVFTENLTCVYENQLGVTSQFTASSYCVGSAQHLL
jgi:hypothetical protein